MLHGTRQVGPATSKSQGYQPCALLQYRQILLAVKPFNTMLLTQQMFLECVHLNSLVVPAGFEPATLSNLETMPDISRVFYR